MTLKIQSVLDMLFSIPHAVIDFNEKDNSLKFDKKHDNKKSGKHNKHNDEDYNDTNSDYSHNKVSSHSSCNSSSSEDEDEDEDEDEEEENEEKYSKKRSRNLSDSSHNSKKSSSSVSSHKSKNSSDNSDDNEKLFKILCLQKANNINDLWFNACLLDKCLFFKNNMVSILMKQKYQENKGILIFYIKNISKAALNLS
ncbi:hypothetical protein PFFCH_00943, partial [Plasmodium falciparum FCH/4]